MFASVSHTPYLLCITAQEGTTRAIATIDKDGNNETIETFHRHLVQKVNKNGTLVIYTPRDDRVSSDGQPDKFTTPDNLRERAHIDVNAYRQRSAIPHVTRLV